ncbi:MAG: uracil-DNA glycosylase [Gammaproteobacteria bacterium]|nr:uracil-DNA glycosylase [Gammaproteobacteria bacterium]
MEDYVQQLIDNTHPEWHPLLMQALAAMDTDYLQALAQSEVWLPGRQAVFAAFTQSLTATQYILLGESPYPRQQSANGYAFWDAAVGDIWSETGLSKAVNRATSLRHWIKMMLHARGDLQGDFSQEAIARLDKSAYIQTLSELFQGLLNQGFLLLNASLVYEPKRVPYHAKHWRPFMSTLLRALSQERPDLQLILLGKIAQQLTERDSFRCFEAEHPYQLTFINNPHVVDFFQPFNLLDKR